MLSSSYLLWNKSYSETTINLTAYSVLYSWWRHEFGLVSPKIRFAFYISFITFHVLAYTTNWGLTTRLYNIEKETSPDSDRFLSITHDIFGNSITFIHFWAYPYDLLLFISTSRLNFLPTRSQYWSHAKWFVLSSGWRLQYLTNQLHKYTILFLGIQANKRCQIAQIGSTHCTDWLLETRYLHSCKLVS